VYKCVQNSDVFFYAVLKHKKRGENLTKELVFEKVTLKHGQKQQCYFEIINTDLKLPITLICGKNDGCTVLVTAGIHNAEFVGIQAVVELASELEAENLCGNIILIPLVNRSGFEHRTMSLVYEDGKNLNRIFPGNSKGTLGDKICYTLVSKLYPKIDYYIDLHSGDGYEELTAHVYTLKAASKKVIDTSLAMAKCVNVPYMYASRNPSYGAYNYAGSMGIPSILLERGCKSLWTRKEVEQDKEDVKNILRYLKVIDEAVKTPNISPVELDKFYTSNSKHTGMWYAEKCAGDFIQKGLLLGTVCDYFGNVLEKCYAIENGVLLYQTISLNILKGDLMVAYGSFK